jgi:hypothetical protein
VDYEKPWKKILGLRHLQLKSKHFVIIIDSLSEFLLTKCYTSTYRQKLHGNFQMAGQANLCKGCGRFSPYLVFSTGLSPWICRLLVFYVGNILDDKNTLCNGCNLNRMISSFQSLHVIWTMFISSHVTDHKFLEDVHKDSMQFLS